MTASFLALVALLGSQGSEGTLPVDLVDNGRFEEAAFPAAGEDTGAAWWRVRAGAPERGADGGVRTSAADVLDQPLAVYTPLVDRLELGGRVEGRGLLELAGAADEVLAAREVEGEFRWRPEGIPGGRLSLRLRGIEGAAPALWLEVRASVALPAPREAELRQELEIAAWEIIEEWRKRGRDDFGPRSTLFMAFDFDAFSGRRSAPMRNVGLHPFHVELLEWYSQGSSTGRSALGRTLELFLDNWFEFALHPTTGLPRQWDPVEDEPVDTRFVEIALGLRFLLDAAEHGPDGYRERALLAARKIGDTVLAHGVLPDGSVAASYRPSDGTPAPHSVPLRSLDVPAELARLGALVDEPRFVAAAREAVLTLDYLHSWPATPRKIDPGFDDNYGHYGARSVVMWKHHPDDPVFRELALSGYRRYAPLLDRLLGLGGYVAADQVRCWRIFTDVAALEPELARETPRLLWRAARNHFKGQQGDAGAWLDVTQENYEPVSNLPVGDLGGLPQNLLEGLAHLAHPRSGLSAAEREALRAMFTAVWRSSREAYRGPYGYIFEARRRTGEDAYNSASGSLRLLPALIDMLAALQGDE